ncbi:MAG: hypothetical protein B7Y39_04720 [Bdellovibrio sp. 28-41-41]|nr:MAG: hypothetical protein B7Y39_04720 [Bdellovibrio sp. 28-41-41]
MRTGFGLLMTLVLISLPSLAARVSLFPISVEQRYLENETQDLYFQKMDTSASAALTFHSYQLGLEVTRWSQESSAPLVSFKESYSEIGSSHLFLMAVLSDVLYLYSGIGVGIYETKLTNQFNGVSNDTNSGQILFASGIASAQVIYSFFHAALDFRLIMAKDYRPQPTPAFIFKLGFSF